MDETLAHEYIRRLVCRELRRCGFDSSSPDAITELEDKLFKLMGGLIHISRSYAELARRTRPTAKDLLLACNDQGITLDVLEGAISENSSQSDAHLALPPLPPIPSTSSSHATDITKRFLADTPDDTTRRATYAPEHLPFLPASHSYKQTPVYPTLVAVKTLHEHPVEDLTVTADGIPVNEKENANPTADTRRTQLDARIRTTRLVEASLQKLMSATSKANQPSAGLEEPEDAMMVDQYQSERQRKENIATLLKRYEKEAAICNFEVEWYAVGGAQGGLAAAGIAGAAGETISAQKGAQRKRGKWRV